MVAVDRASAHRTSCCVILRRVLRLIVHRGPAYRHHSNVLRDVLLADKVAHVVLVGDRILVIFPLLLLLLPYLAQLGARKLQNFPEHIHQASILCLDRQPAQLLLHLCRDALGPPAHLIVDQLHVLLALVLLRQLLLQLALLHLQHGILRLISLHVILGLNQLAHVLVIGLVGLLIVRAGLLANLSLVLICDLKLSHLLLFHQIKGFQFVIFSLIRGDSTEQRCICLLLGHEFLNDLTHITDIRLHANLLETVLNMSIVGHLPRHSLLEEGRPGSVHKQCISFLQLILVL